MTTHEHGIFRYIDPPNQIALDQCVQAIEDCFYPWERCLPELKAESQGKVNVIWGDAGQSVTGTYREVVGDLRNVITLNTRYHVPNYAFTMLHEAGHMVDDTALIDPQRKALVNKWHQDDEGPWNNNPHAEGWGHEDPHTHRGGYPDGGWRVTDAHYYLKPNEAFADTFVACFAPMHFAYPRFAHWSSDYTGLRAIILPQKTPEPVPPKPVVSKFPNDSVYRLYRAVFLREPDDGGYAHWLFRHNAGEPLKQIAEFFTMSTEFKNRYGSISNNQFVTLLYNNVLNRAPDLGGLANWVNLLNRGSTRGSVVIGFSESTEFIRKIDFERK